MFQNKLSTPTTPSALVLGLPIVLALTLSSCGGGTTAGTDTSTPTASSTTTTSTGTTSTNQTRVASDSTTSTSTTSGTLSVQQTAILAATNAARAVGFTCAATSTEPRKYFAPTKMVTWNTQLAQAAQSYAQTMASYNFFDHTNNNGMYGPTDFTKRIEAAGYTNWTNLGENLAQFSSNLTAQDVVNGWLGSTDGHCQTLMDPQLTDLGIGVATSGNVIYWVQEFGSK